MFSKEVYFGIILGVVLVAISLWLVDELNPPTNKILFVVGGVGVGFGALAIIGERIRKS